MDCYIKVPGSTAKLSLCCLMGGLAKSVILVPSALDLGQVGNPGELKCTFSHSMFPAIGPAAYT
jgi:hypothetical protein